MKIAMFSNSYLPHVGGVARAVKTLEDACRKRGHAVRVIAPAFDGAEPSPNVLRVPAIQHFNGSDFPLQLPVPNLIREFIKGFAPDIIHSHHPFLLGDSALREARKMRVPIVFTHHTLYERYTHYVPLDSPALKRVAIQLATDYCNLCDQIIAPSESIARLLREREVVTPIAVIPTGIDVELYANGNGKRFREMADIPLDAKVIGHVGRLAEEKNLTFLTKAVASCLREDSDAVFLIVGDGEDREAMLTILNESASNHQIRAVGAKTGTDLADAYAAMDWFVFASQSETQGLVLAEAMASGKPVIALDGPGVREIIKDEENGLLLSGHATIRDFSTALNCIMHDPELTQYCSEHARQTAEDYSADRCIQSLLDCYAQLIASHTPPSQANLKPWDQFLTGIHTEWDLLREKMSAASAAVIQTSALKNPLD